VSITYVFNERNTWLIHNMITDLWYTKPGTTFARKWMKICKHLVCIGHAVSIARHRSTMPTSCFKYGSVISLCSLRFASYTILMPVDPRIIDLMNTYRYCNYQSIYVHTILKTHTVAIKNWYQLKRGDLLCSVHNNLMHFHMN